MASEPVSLDPGTGLSLRTLDDRDERSRIPKRVMRDNKVLRIRNGRGQIGMHCSAFTKQVHTRVVFATLTRRDLVSVLS